MINKVEDHPVVLEYYLGELEQEHDKGEYRILEFSIDTLSSFWDPADVEKWRKIAENLMNMTSNKKIFRKFLLATDIFTVFQLDLAWLEC